MFLLQICLKKKYKRFVRKSLAMSALQISFSGTEATIAQRVFIVKDRIVIYSA